jgi:hypothetical protein
VVYEANDQLQDCEQLPEAFWVEIAVPDCAHRYEAEIQIVGEGCRRRGRGDARVRSPKAIAIAA